MESQSAKQNAKDKILNAALKVIREQGYSATTVDDLCEEAKVTKGAFFHHFKSKEDLAVAAAQYWSDITGELFKTAPYHKHKDPLDRLLGYVDFRKELLQGDVPEFTCLVGTMVQETYDSNPSIRNACEKSIFGHASTLIEFIDDAKKLYAPKAAWSSEGLAFHTQAVLQGAFILAKAKNDSAFAAESVDHLHNYIELLFQRPSRKQN
jgi:TetR/AcrR family transcriptional repressor of nem operon